jgi:hypothetical protein
MIYESLLKAKVLTIIKTYEDVPINNLTKDSLVEEIAQEISEFMSEGDGPEVIKNFMEDIDLGKWEQE